MTQHSDFVLKGWTSKEYDKKTPAHQCANLLAG